MSVRAGPCHLESRAELGIQSLGAWQLSWEQGSQALQGMSPA